MEVLTACPAEHCIDCLLQVIEANGALAGDLLSYLLKPLLEEMRAGAQHILMRREPAVARADEELQESATEPGIVRGCLTL